MHATNRLPHTPPTESTWQTTFLAWLPSIEKQLSFAFRHLDHEAREEYVQEAIANCCVQYGDSSNRVELQLLPRHRSPASPSARFALAGW